MIANTIQPDVAIVTDVCHDTNTPWSPPAKEEIWLVAKVLS